MSGRAGRAGIDPWGESFLMVRPNGSNRLQLQALVKVGIAGCCWRLLPADSSWEQGAG